MNRKEGKLATTAKRQTRDDYLALVLEFPLVSIRSDGDLERAVAVMDSLLARGRLTAGAEQYLDALSDLVELYEEHHMKIEAPTDGAMLLHLLESTGKSQSGVATATGIKKVNDFGSCERQEDSQPSEHPEDLPPLWRSHQFVCGHRAIAHGR